MCAVWYIGCTCNGVLYYLQQCESGWLVCESTGLDMDLDRVHYTGSTERTGIGLERGRFSSVLPFRNEAYASSRLLTGDVLGCDRFILALDQFILALRSVVIVLVPYTRVDTVLFRTFQLRSFWAICAICYSSFCNVYYIWGQNSLQLA